MRFTVLHSAFNIPIGVISQEFLESLECTKENWKERLEEVFQSVKETYGRNFNEGSEFNNFPENTTELRQNYIVEYVYQQVSQY